MAGKFKNINKAAANSKEFEHILDSINSKEDCEEALGKLNPNAGDFGRKQYLILEICKFFADDRPVYRVKPEN